MDNNATQPLTPDQAYYIGEKALISTGLLFDLSKQGRNVLAYMIDVTFPRIETYLNIMEALRATKEVEIPTDSRYRLVKLSPADIVSYLAPIIGKQATHYNVKRGIANLIEKGVITKKETVDQDWYRYDTKRIEKWTK